MDKHISHSIVEACKKHGIPYKSCNPNYVRFDSDAQLLGQLYRDLLEMSVKLQEIGERHNIPGLKEILNKDIDSLVTIDHDLIRLAHKIKEEKK